MIMNTVEMLGYLSSIIVALSLTMKDIIKLRVLNFIGCSLFAIYGLMIDAWPVAATNGFIAGVNIYFIARIYYDSHTQENSSATAEQ
ncbi:YgjV family protein [Photobacterium japonica]|uniref:hypothetical protein n=1 Tax=Photobacterium japonica TaxID=2910235 RepID=UPI003D12F010